MKLFSTHNSIIQNFKRYESQKVSVDVKREDLLHPIVSGNKLRKLKYNLIAARNSGYNKLLTFGGAFSNHIIATAAAGRICDFKTIGIIRGEELGKDFNNTLSNNPTLNAAHKLGMEFKFVSREAYRNKYEDSFISQLKYEFGSFYHIPEGGTNELAVKGTSEILIDDEKNNYDVVCVAAGTGGTAAGIIESSSVNQRINVFSALKGDFLKQAIQDYTSRTNFIVLNEERFGGYAKSDDDLIKFMNLCFRESGIPLDPIYTGKMMYCLEDLILSGTFPAKTRILAIHTGGLQGLAGYNRLLKKKGRRLIDYENSI